MLQGGNLHAVVMKICNGEFAALPDDADSGLVSMVSSMLQKTPADRPTMSAVSKQHFVENYITKALPQVLQSSQVKLSSPRIQC